MSTEDGSNVVINDCKRSGIVDDVTDRSAALPTIDPFQNTAPLPPSTSDIWESETICPTEVTDDFVNLRLAYDDSHWECEDDDFNRNTFDFTIDDDDE